MLKLARATQLQMTVLADAEIHRALSGQTGAPPPLDTQEALGVTVSSALPAVADAWSGVLRALGIGVRAICAFSFGGPIVVFRAEGAERRCSLGAALIVIDDLSGPTAARRALLLSVPGAAGERDGPDGPQQYLYAKWPAFRFEDGYQSTPREFECGQGGVCAAGEIARIDLSSPCPAWTFPAAAHNRDSHDSLGACLVALAIGAAGREVTPGGSDDWSLTVHELLQRTAAASVSGLRPHPMLRTATTYRGDRGSGVIVFENRTNLPIETALSESAALATRPAEGPISVIHFAFK
jgi:hypothetical protein